MECSRHRHLRRSWCRRVKANPTVGECPTSSTRFHHGRKICEISRRVTANHTRSVAESRPISLRASVRHRGASTTVGIPGSLLRGLSQRQGQSGCGRVTRFHHGRNICEVYPRAKARRRVKVCRRGKANPVVGECPTCFIITAGTPTRPVAEPTHYGRVSDLLHHPGRNTCEAWRRVKASPAEDECPTCFITVAPEIDSPTGRCVCGSLERAPGTVCVFPVALGQHCCAPLSQRAQEQTVAFVGAKTGARSGLCMRCSFERALCSSGSRALELPCCCVCENPQSMASQAGTFSEGLKDCQEQAATPQRAFNKRCLRGSSQRGPGWAVALVVTLDER